MRDAFWSSRDVCVTGGAGFLGWHIAQLLLKRGARVRLLSLEPRPEHPARRRPEVVGYWGDVRDAGVVRAALAGCSVVFHTAGLVGVWGKMLELMRSVHVEGTRQVLAWAGRDARIVHTSSITTLGAFPRPRPVDESTAWNKAAADVPYVQAKRGAEALALEAAHSGRDVVVTNPGYLVGPEDHEHSVIGRLCERFWRGRAPLVPPGGLNLADVRDVALGHLLAAEHGRRGERYLLGGEDHSFASFFALLARVAGFRPRALPRFPWPAFAAFAGLAELRAHFTGKEPYPSLAHATMNYFYWYGSSAKAERDLGYRRRPLIETLRDTFAWLSAGQTFQPRGFNRWWFRPTPAA